VTRRQSIQRHAEDGTWTLFQRPPPAALLPYVRSLQGYVEQSGPAYVRKELPSGIVPFIVVFGGGFALHDLATLRFERALDRSFVAGMHQVPALIGYTGRALCMQVDLTPLGAWRLLGLDMHEIAGRVIDVDAILGSDSRELEEKLACAPDWSARFDLLERVLCRRILRARSEDRRVSAAWSAILRSDGAIRIGDIAAELGCSRKHLIALFKREIGLPPKAAARVVRFERAMVQLQAKAFRSLTELASACGYADHAHFSRDFRAFAGESPSALLPSLEPHDGSAETARE